MKRKVGPQIRITIEPGDFVTVAEAAKILERPRITIYRWIETGIMLSVKIGGTIIIPWSEVERLNELKVK